MEKKILLIAGTIITTLIGVGIGMTSIKSTTDITTNDKPILDYRNHILKDEESIIMNMTSSQ